LSSDIIGTNSIMYKKLASKYRYSFILLRELVITEFKLRYQGSALGYLWSLLRPLFMFVILYFVFVYFLRIGSDIPHWPVALLLGIVLWNFFAEVTNNGLGSIVGRGDVIRKINFPKYVIVLASSVSAFINLLLNLVVIGVFMAINGVSLSWGAILSPIFILEIFAFAVGLALILSALYVRLRDLNYIWEIIMQAMFYASAVIYPISMVVEKSQSIATVIMLNPITQSIQDIRHFLISDSNPNLLTLTGDIYWYLIPVGIVIITGILGVVIFKKQSPYFAENV
jgi:ABC-2 type transport system permease protein